VEAIRYLERAVLEAEGVQGTVLRYGGFYGPGTSAGEPQSGLLHGVVGLAQPAEIR
jgi:nucleoside-diphosphate-sugar epimerase